jgi:valyl-tRNA synthetase
LEAAIRESIGQLDASARAEVDSLKEVITRIRALKAEYNVASRKDVPFFVLSESDREEILRAHAETILNLAQIESLEPVKERPEGMPAGVTGLGTVFLDLAHAIDVSAERERLEKELGKLEKGIQAGEAKLNNPKFVDNAPEAVVAGAREQLAATKARHAEINELLSSLPNA